MTWTDSGKIAVKNVQSAILKKKIVLNIVIECYSRWDRIFRYGHMILAISTPMMAFIDQVVSGSVQRTSTATVIIGTIVAGMIKLKDYLKFSKTKTQAKQQAVKYQELYQRIERGIRMATSTRINEEDFIASIIREYSIIEMDDPELTTSLKKKYVNLCKSRGIPYDEDMDALEVLTREMSIRSVPGSVRSSPGDGNSPESGHSTRTHAGTGAGASADPDLEAGQIAPVASSPDAPANNTDDLDQQEIKRHDAERPQTSLEMASAPPVPAASNPSNPSNPSNHSNPSNPSNPPARLHRTTRAEYREKIKSLDASTDLRWVMDRMQSL